MEKNPQINREITITWDAAVSRMPLLILNEPDKLMRAMNKEIATVFPGIIDIVQVEFL
jgi:hypothetical protein